jgi:hypothetical protein
VIVELVPSWGNNSTIVEFGVVWETNSPIVARRPALQPPYLTAASASFTAGRKHIVDVAGVEPQAPRFHPGGL